MNYIFAPADGDVCDFEATFTVDGNTVSTTMTNTPTRRNCRTNIVGKVLTSKVETNIIVDAAVDGDESLDGYKDNGYAASIPAGPADMTAETIDVTAENAQYVLDGAYGSIDGKTVNFTESITDQILVLGRPNKFSGSNTKYMVGGYDDTADGYQEFSTAEALVEYLATNSGSRYYTRAIENVKFTASEGVVIAGILASSGHTYGTTTAPVYDYVRDSGSWCYDTNTSYRCAYTLKGVEFNGITFLKNAKFTKNSNAESPSTIDGLTFKNCKFLAYSKSSAAGARVYFQNNSSAFENAFQNIVVDGCEFITSYQGIYTQYVYNLTVTNSKFTGTCHNAIALQSNTVTPQYGSIVITNNTFEDIGDRIIRFGNVASLASITVTGNTSTNSGDESGQLMKTGAIPTGFAQNISDNKNDGVLWVDKSTTSDGKTVLLFAVAE